MIGDEMENDKLKIHFISFLPILNGRDFNFCHFYQGISKSCLLDQIVMSIQL